MDAFIAFNVFNKYGLGDGDLPGAREFQYALCASVKRELAEKYPGIDLVLAETSHNERPVAVEWKGERVVFNDDLPNIVENDAPQFAKDTVAAYAARSHVIAKFVKQATRLESLIQEARAA